MDIPIFFSISVLSVIYLTNKFDKYITDKTDIVKNMGNKFSYIADDNSRGDMLDTMFNNYKEDN